MVVDIPTLLERDGFTYVAGDLKRAALCTRLRQQASTAATAATARPTVCRWT